MRYPIKQQRDDCVSLSGKGFFGKLGLLVVAALSMLAACQQPVIEEPTIVEVPKVIEVPVEVPVEVPRCELPEFNDGRKFVAEAWAVPDSQFDVGEPLRLQMRVSSRSYMNIFHVSTSCKVTRLLHNLPMRAAEIVAFPLQDSGIEMIVKPPPGRESFYFIATREKLTFLSSADILKAAGGIASIDLSPAQFYTKVAAEVQGRVNPDDWSMKTLQTTVVGH